MLQAVMGWRDYHLHLFLADGVLYGEPGAIEGMRLKRVKTTALSDIAPVVGTTFTYEYDFGDNWRHTLRVENVLPFDEDGEYPVCLAGRRACPPEDCGGVSGYYELLEALRDRRHPEHSRVRAWFGGEFDQKAFDLAAVNRALRRPAIGSATSSPGASGGTPTRPPDASRSAQLPFRGP